MKFHELFFQPKNYYPHVISSVAQIYDNKYHTEMIDFMNTFETESANEADRLHQSLLICFCSTNTNAGFTALTNRERFWIMRALARFSSQQRTAILLLANELCPNRPSYEIIDALCIMTCSTLRQDGSKNPSTAADLESPLEDGSARNLIYHAILLVKEINEPTTREKQETLARYFLVEGTVEGKINLAQRAIESLQKTNKFELKSATGSIITFSSQPAVEKRSEHPKPNPLTPRFTG